MPICKKCLLEKPVERFYLPKATGKLSTGCKDCTNARAREWVKNNPEKRSANTHNHYAKKIGKHPDECRGSIGSEEWRKRKKPNKTPYYHRNRQQLLEKVKARAKTKKAELSAYHKEWRAKNVEKKREQDRQWRQDHPELVNLYSNSRRARKLRSQPTWLSAIQLAQMLEFYDIAQARQAQTGVEHHVDHIFPLHGKVFSGLHVPWNLQILAKQENLKKGQSVPSEFAAMLDYSTPVTATPTR